MKAKLITLFTLFLLLISSCTKDKVNPTPELPVTPNKVSLLQVNTSTFAFEGGKELTIQPAASFTIDTDFQSPSDFGWVKLFCDETDEMLFHGSMIWMGNGYRYFPETLDSTGSFETVNASAPQPADSLFEKIMYAPGNSYYPTSIDYQSIWNAVSNLAVVTAYRNSNPGGKVYLFRYVPSPLGGAAPKWYVIIKD